jgi:hypothetical protein
MSNGVKNKVEIDEENPIEDEEYDEEEEGNDANKHQKEQTSHHNDLDFDSELFDYEKFLLRHGHSKSVGYELKYDQDDDLLDVPHYRFRNISEVAAAALLNEKLRRGSLKYPNSYKFNINSPLLREKKNSYPKSSTTENKSFLAQQAKRNKDRKRNR